MSKEERMKVLAKVQKLFALGTSPNQAEAESAVAKAHELLARYNMSLKDVSVDDKEFVQEALFEGKTNRPSWQRDMAHIIADHFMVTMISVRYGNHAENHSYGMAMGNNIRTFKIVGDPANVEMASYAVSFLVATYKRLGDAYIKVYKKELKEEYDVDNFQSLIGHLVKARTSYYHGLNIGLQEALRKQVQREEEMGLVLVKDPDLQKYIESITNGNLKHQKNADINPAAANQGIEDGKNIRIRGAVETDSAQSGRPLALGQ